MIKYQIYNYSKANNIASLVITIKLLIVSFADRFFLRFYQLVQVYVFNFANIAN